MLHLRASRQQTTVLIIFHGFNIRIREEVRLRRLRVLAWTEFLRQRSGCNEVGIHAPARTSVSVDQPVAYLRLILLYVQVIIIISIIIIRYSVFRTV